MYVGERWSRTSDLDTGGASAGAAQTAVDPLPTSTTCLSLNVRRSSSAAVWTISPLNVSAPGKRGTYGAEK